MDMHKQIKSTKYEIINWIMCKLYDNSKEKYLLIKKNKLIGCKI